jgi:hypothetical protein
MLRDEYLGELEANASTDALADIVTNGNFVTVTLANIGSGISPLRGTAGIYMANIEITDEVTAEATSAYGKQIDITDSKRLENAYLGDQTNRIWFVFDGKVWVYGDKYVEGSTTGISEVTAYYLKTPVTMTTSVDPEIAEQFHGIMLDFAEADCLALEANWNGRSVALNRGLTTIQELNERYINPEGIGIKEKD